MQAVRALAVVDAVVVALRRLRYLLLQQALLRDTSKIRR